MDPNFKAEIERQQRKMLDKMSTVLNKLESMKRQLEDVLTKAYESEMNDQKRIKFCAPWSLKRKAMTSNINSEKVKATLTVPNIKTPS